MNKEFYGCTQNNSIPGTRIAEVFGNKGIVTFYPNPDKGLNQTFKEEAQKLGANAVVNVTLQVGGASPNYDVRTPIVYIGDAVFLERNP